MNKNAEANNSICLESEFRYACAETIGEGWTDAMK